MGVAGTLVSKNLVGRCGLYCGFCLIYRAGKDSEKLRRAVARRSKCKPEDVRCEGCQTVLVDGWNNARWSKNCKIIKCQEAKGVKFCYECDVYPRCKRFHSIADHSLKRGEDLMANLEKIKAGKVEEWLEEEDREWRCSKCGNLFPCILMSVTGVVLTSERPRSARACGYGFCWDEFCI